MKKLFLQKKVIQPALEFFVYIDIEISYGHIWVNKKTAEVNQRSNIYHMR
jgi:hypothetical protein